MARAASSSQSGELAAIKNETVANPKTKSVARFRDAHFHRCQVRNHTQARTTPTTANISSRYSTKGLSMTSHVPPSPMSESPIGKTQQDAVSNASNPEAPTNNLVGADVVGPSICSVFDVMCRDIHPVATTGARRQLSHVRDWSGITSERRTD